MIKKPNHVNIIYQGEPQDLPIQLHFFMPRSVWQKVHEILAVSEDEQVKEVAGLLEQMLNQLKFLEAQAEYEMLEMVEEITSKIH